MSVQREQILSHALNQLEKQGLSASTEHLLHEIAPDFNMIRQFWPDDEALVYDCLRYHGQQIEIWQRQTRLDESLSPNKNFPHATNSCTNVLAKGVSLMFICLSL